VSPKGVPPTWLRIIATASPDSGSPQAPEPPKPKWPNAFGSTPEVVPARWYPRRQCMLIITAASRPTFDRSEPTPVPAAPSTGCSRVASRSVSAVSSGGPSNASGVASAAYIRASERAVNTPFAAGISASWIRSVWPTSKMSSTTSAEYNGAYRSKRESRRSRCSNRTDAFGSTSSVEMRLRTSGGAPMYIWPSRPSGSTISRWSAWFTVRPVTRRINSPTSQPYVSA
jgi:hypothetical protein